MDIKLNRKDQLPIHTQLKAQLIHLIQTRQLPTGTQLPTVRQLAGFLRVNRNTVSKVFSEMEREGFLSCVPGRGSFVSSPKMESRMKVEKMHRLLAVVDDALARAKRLGFSPEELSLTLYARAQTTSEKIGLPGAATLFIECIQSQVDLFTKELREELSIQVDSMLLEDLKKVVEKTPESLKRYTLLITTFYHIREVQALVAESGIEVVGLLVDTSLDTLMRLTALPDGTKVGVACTDRTGAENIKLSIERAGLKHLRVVLGCGDVKESLRKMVRGVSVIVCSSLVEDKVRALTTGKQEIIVDQRGLDKAGVEMLRSRLMELVSSDYGWGSLNIQS